MGGLRSASIYGVLLGALLFAGGMITPGVVVAHHFNTEHRRLAYSILLFVCLSPFAFYVGYMIRFRPGWYFAIFLWVWFVFNAAIWGIAHMVGLDDPYFAVPPAGISRLWQIVVACVCFMAASLVCGAIKHRLAAGRTNAEVERDE